MLVMISLAPGLMSASCCLLLDSCSEQHVLR